MKTIIAITAALILALCLTGCGGNTAPKDVQAKETEQIVKLLPPGYKNLQSLGNQWFYYELKVGGVDRKFMARYWFGSHGEVGITTTELRADPLAALLDRKFDAEEVIATIDNRPMPRIGAETCIACHSGVGSSLFAFNRPGTGYFWETRDYR